MLDITCNILSNCPLNATTIAVNTNADIDSLKQQALEARNMLDVGDGVLVLTDLYGSTPANIAATLSHMPGTVVIAGLSIPMLTKVMNYPDLDLENSANKAMSACTEGCIRCTHS